LERPARALPQVAGFLLNGDRDDARFDLDARRCGLLGDGIRSRRTKGWLQSVCLYESRSYSEGAFVCVQKSLMLTCVSDGAHVSWKPVVEKDINDRCTAPTVQHTPPEPRFHSHRRHVAVSRIRWPVDGSKCFWFNGRQYCE
jgi:hypothetical protein